MPLYTETRAHFETDLITMRIMYHNVHTLIPAVHVDAYYHSNLGQSTHFPDADLIVAIGV